MANNLVQWQRLKFAATINDEALTEDVDPDFEIQYIDIGNVNSSGAVNQVVTYRFEAAPSRARRIVRDGDVIISTVRTYLQGIAPITAPPENLIVSTGFAVIRPRPQMMDPKFCRYALREPNFLAEVEKRSTGISYPAINASEIGDIAIPLPPLSAQKLIADYVETETADIDALIAAKQKLLDLMAEKRRAIVTEAVMRGLDPSAPLRPSGIDWLGDIPAHWEALDLKWVVARVTSGVSVNATNQPAEGDELGVLKTSAVLGGSFFPLENKSVWLHEYERVTCPVTAGSIIVSRMNTPLLVGESGYVETDHPNLFLPDRLWKIETNVQRALPRFIAQVLSSPMVRSAISEMATGTSASMKNLSQDDLLGLPIPLPPLDEQHQIVEQISTETAKIDRLRTATENSVALLKERRAALIAAAVTGQIEIPEAA
ncbi:restriction endonuclease subunit S [Agrobacterium tumefaciens]|uniref:restriction endonuclease subunit S n=1 Tax=Agrobacterium tumefaciens TaxID=358 RepID=UPI00277D4AD4|nr:restriction endonuclease subunit S [Agrobacterium tumefaciens]MDP9875246.1 type I restriction enzyme S subunit [Agrobacterium tumefaciens]MDP9980365.1 type I restriction enzyme S subunit [Agrobacterium tumefaciens]